MSFTQEQVDKMVSEAVENATKGMVSQSDFDKIIEGRLSREKSKYQDYDELKKFHEEHKASQEKKNQEDLENQKKYEEAKKSYETKIGELSGKLSEKDLTIRDMRITNALTSEIVNQNGFVEETLALLKQNTVVDDTGVVLIKGKDANGIDTTLSITDGIKDFLTKRPHLVKAKGTGGTGSTGSGGAGATGNSGNESLSDLNMQLMKARNIGDYKAVNELKAKITKLIPGNRNAA